MSVGDRWKVNDWRWGEEKQSIRCQMFQALEEQPSLFLADVLGKVSFLSEEKKIHLESSEQGEMKSMKSEMAKTLSAEQTRFLSDVQVHVEVEIGTLQMSAANLIDLFEGQSFDFDFDENTLVSLKVGEELVAKAQFCLFGDSLGLQIVSVGGGKTNF